LLADAAYLRQRNRIINKNVQQAFGWRQPHPAQQCGACHICVHQHHRVVQFHGDADRQICRGKRFSLARQRAGDHDQVAVLDPRSAFSHGIVDQRTLDHAELVGKPRT
jgi:hypothetical protein